MQENRSFRRINSHLWLVPVVFIGFIFMFTFCHGNGGVQVAPDESTADSVDFPLSGDSTIYGLACDGCTDSVVVLLPRDCSDPIQFNIIEAKKNHGVFGHPQIGEWIAVIVSASDSLKAERVICLDDLMGQWCYKVMPSLVEPAGDHPQLPDSVIRSLMVPREYGISLRRQWTASSLGFVPRKGKLDDESPVQYPRVQYYRHWHLWNGKLLLTRGKMQMDKDNNPQMLDDGIDTCTISLLEPDSLILQFSDHSQSFYRKKEENSPVTKH